MKISKKVANVMSIGGVVGILSSWGAVMYFGTQMNRPHPIEQALTELTETFTACAYNHDEASCQKWKQQYAGLETELVGLENDSAYQQFIEDRDRNKTYLRSSVTGVLLMMVIMAAGRVIHGRREDEELDQYARKQVQAMNDKAQNYMAVPKQ
ncbi:MAG: hypothetical protein AABW48_04670 [Nanoarchaeota archaeon]